MRSLPFASHFGAFSLKLHLRGERTNGQRDLFVRLSIRPSVRSFVFLSVVSVRGVHPMGGERTAMLRRNLRGNKNPGSANKYTKFGQLITRKIIKIIATRCHILRVKYTKFDSLEFDT